MPLSFAGKACGVNEDVRPMNKEGETKMSLGASECAPPPYKKEKLPGGMLSGLERMVKRYFSW